MLKHLFLIGAFMISLFPVTYAEAPMIGVTKPDLSLPEYDPPDCPAWAKQTLPEWVRPFVGLHGAPPPWNKSATPFGDCVKGLDRYQSNQFIWWRPETDAYLYGGDYTPLTVNYKPGVLPDFEKIAMQYTVDCVTDTEKAMALLTNALFRITPHPSMPPLSGKSTPPDRNLDDKALLASGSAWCNEQARIFVRLCQVLGIQGRIVHIFGQAHTIAEFYADGKWALADASYYFVVPGPDGKLLSVKDCHDRGSGQLAYAQAKARRMQELAAMTDRQLNFNDPKAAAKFRLQCADFDVDAVAKATNFVFGIINYPLPPAK